MKVFDTAILFFIVLSLFALATLPSFAFFTGAVAAVLIGTRFMVDPR